MVRTRINDLFDIEEVIARDLTQSVAATGKIQPEIEVMLSSEVSGEIIELPISEGDQVQKGICWCALIPI